MEGERDMSREKSGEGVNERDIEVCREREVSERSIERKEERVKERDAERERRESLCCYLTRKRKQLNLFHISRICNIEITSPHDILT